MTKCYTYEAVDGAGQKRRGVEAAMNSAAVHATLEARGLIVLALREADAALPAAPAPGPPPPGSGSRDVLEVTRALAALLPAGLPLARALHAAADVAGPDVGTALREVQGRVERGESLARAMAEYSTFFPPLYVGLVRAGERSGNLASAFQRLAHQLERDQQLRSKLISVSIYPLLLAVAGGMAVLVLLLLVIPRFVELLQGTGAALPRSTALVMGISAGLRRYWPALLALPAGLGALLAWMRTSDEGRRTASRLLLGTPLLRSYRQNALGARFSRLLGTLLGGGAPLLTALDDTIESVGDPLGRDEAVRIRSRVREGVALHRAIAEGGFFPPILTQLVTVGEEAGQLQTFLDKAADILEERTERLLQRLVALVEPVMILVFGGVVGFVALSLLQAIYSVNAGSFR
ncbi:MAG: type II secretion system F family protein [Gemmatimonadales bacterium]|nr:type II secretion system F family protein [Gemmatimonadales bacterium]